MVKLFKIGAKDLALMIFGTVFLVLNFWVLNAPKAEAEDYKFLEVKLDTDACTTCDSYELWQFHGIKGGTLDPLPHVDDKAKLNIPDTSVPPFNECGMWVIEEITAGVDTGGILYVKKGRKITTTGKLNDSGNLGAEDTDWKWCSCTESATPGDCTQTGTSNGTDIRCVAGNPASVLNYDYQDMGSFASTEDLTLAVGGTSHAYKPKFDILCADTNNWKTCESNSCATVGTDSWACEGATKIWSKCISPEVCIASTGVCGVSTITPTPVPVNNCVPADGCNSNRPKALDCVADYFATPPIATKAQALCCVNHYYSGPAAVCTGSSKTSPCAPHGDINGDSYVDSLDVFAFENAPVKNILINADVNDDGINDDVDKTLISNFVNGVITTFPRCASTTTTTLIINNPSTLNSIQAVTAGIINWLLGLAGGLVIIFLIIGGIYYITAAGDEEQIGKAKKIVTYAIIGLIFILVSYTLVATLNKIIFG